MAIKVFGTDAIEIDEKEHFIAFHYSVEGRDCVELIPARLCCDKCDEICKVIDLGHDDIDLVCVNEKCSECAVNYVAEKKEKANIATTKNS